MPIFLKISLCEVLSDSNAIAMPDLKQVCATEEEEQCAIVYEDECQSRDEQVYNITISFLSANTSLYQHIIVAYNITKNISRLDLILKYIIKSGVRPGVSGRVWTEV